MGRPIKKGSTDQSTTIRIIDSTNFTPENSVEYDTAGIDLWFRREQETKTSITEAALASLDSAHADGGIELIGNGYYRLDLPDPAVAAGSGENSVLIGGTITGMIVIGNEHALVDYDPYDAVRLGLTALPNAAADAAGGLPVSDGGGLDVDAILEDSNELQGNQGDWATAVGFSTHSAADVKTAMEAEGTSDLDAIADAIANVTYGLSALKDLIDAIPTTKTDYGLASDGMDSVICNVATVGATPSLLLNKIQALWNRSNTKKTVTASLETAYEANDSTVMETWDLADDDTTASRTR